MFYGIMWKLNACECESKSESTSLWKCLALLQWTQIGYDEMVQYLHHRTSEREREREKQLAHEKGEIREGLKATYELWCDQHMSGFFLCSFSSYEKEEMKEVFFFFFFFVYFRIKEMK